jgi:hypothetical protein
MVGFCRGAPQAGKVGMPECGPPGWQPTATPWPMWHLPALPIPPMWSMMPPHPQYATEELRTLILAAASHASQQEIARFSQVGLGPGGEIFSFAPPPPPSTPFSHGVKACVAHARPRAYATFSTSSVACRFGLSFVWGTGAGLPC